MGPMPRAAMSREARHRASCFTSRVRPSRTKSPAESSWGSFALR